VTVGRLEELLSAFNSVRVAVVGDFFLDKYLDIDATLDEVSLETGKTAYQVVATRCSPGAAGTVTNNLAALGVAAVYAVGVVGTDGQGYELKQGLAATGVRLDYMLECNNLMTPTYIKPLVRREDGAVEELNRFDIKNRQPLPPEVEEGVIKLLRRCVPQVDGIVIADQVQERNYGVVTDRMRDVLAQLAAEHPDKVFFADSRARIGEFTNVIIKPNQHEARAALQQSSQRTLQQQSQPLTVSEAEQAALALARRSRRPVYVTLGDRGILVCDGRNCRVIPAPRVTGPIDIVGAGDAVTAGIVPSLCAGASVAEAALIGNLVASITIQQIGTTGTASRRQVLERFAEVEGEMPDV